VAVSFIGGGNRSTQRKPGKPNNLKFWGKLNQNLVIFLLLNLQFYLLPSLPFKMIK
jgi:hypothetical protein